MRPKIKGARETLLRSGKEILISVGYKKLKIKDVTRSAGVSAGTFYSYFDNKRSFAMTIIEDAWDDVVDEADRLIGKKSTYYNKMKKIYRAIEEFENDYHNSLMQSIHDCEPNYFTGIYDRDTEKLIVRLNSIMEDAIAMGEVRADVAGRSEIVRSMTSNMIYNARTKDFNFDDFYKVLMMIIGKGNIGGEDDRTKDWMQRILDTTQTKIFWKDNERRFVGVNKAFVDYYGFESESELIGKNDEELGWHSDPDPFMNDEVRVLAGESTHRVHGKCIAKGEERDIVASKSPMYDNGQIIGLVGSFEDVTVEYQQRNEIGRLNSVLDAIPGGIAVYKRRFDEFYCVSLNDYLLEMVGGSREDYVGKGLNELAGVVHPDDRERMFADSAELHKEKHSTSGIYRFLNKDNGEYKWFQIEGKLVRHTDDEEFAYYSYIDVDELERAKAAEEMSRRLYGYAVNAANLFLWSYDVKTKTMTFDDNEYTNRSRRRLGLPEEIDEAPGFMLQFILPEDRGRFLKMFSDLDEGKTYSACEIRFRAKPKRMLLYLRMSFTVEFDDKGKPTKGYGMTQDITKERLAAEEYKREESFIRADDESGYVAKGHYDLTQNSVINYWKSWNSAMDVTRDLTYDEVLNRVFDYIARDEDKEKCRELFARDNLLYKFETGEDTVSIEYRRAGGIYAATWVAMDLKMFVGPVSGDVECFIYMYDVTEKHVRRQTAENLKEMGYKYIGLIDTVDRSATYFKFKEDNNGMEIYANSRNYDEDIIDTVKMFVNEDDLEGVIKSSSLSEIADSLANKDNYSFMCDARSSSGERIRIASNYKYLDDEKRIVYNAVQDVTKQYRAEQEQMARLDSAMKDAARANSLKSTFLSSVSHDMRTPLNAVLGYDRLALDIDDIVAKDEYLKKIASAGNTLLSLINDTLDLQKIESDAIELKPEHASRQRIVDDILTAVKPLMDEKNIEFNFDDSKAIKATLNIDVMRVEKVFINLLSNAIKFTPEGGHIDFIVECTEQNEDRVKERVIVRDNGVGMSKEFLPKVFEPFTQERTEETATIGGTGLGLSIVKSLVGKMGGTIDVKSELGKGTEFVVCLNLERVEAQEDEKLSCEVDVGAIDLDGVKILLVEDNAMNQEIAESVLTAKGAGVEMASNGKTGVDMFNDSIPGTYDIILMDIRMPVMDGYEATMNIRNSQHPDGRTVPIIAMTADAYEEDVEKSRNWGMNGHIAKPIDPARLFRLISVLVPKVK